MKTIITHNDTPWVKEQLGYVNLFLQIYHPQLILSISTRELTKEPEMKGDRFDPEWLDKNVHIPVLFKDAWISVYTMDRSEFKKLGGKKTMRGYQPPRNVAIGEIVVLAEKRDWVYFDKTYRTTSSERRAKRYDFHMPQWAYTFTHELGHLLAEFYGKYDIEWNGDKWVVNDHLHEYCERGEFEKYFSEYLS